MIKIPPGVYSEKDGTLKRNEKGYILSMGNWQHESKYVAYATIGYEMPGIPQLEVRERSAEEFLKESFIKNVQSRWPGVEWEAANGKDGSGYQWVYEAMHAFRSQPIAPVSEEEIEKMTTMELIPSVFLNYPTDEEEIKQFDELKGIYIKAYKAALSRPQSWYTREQVEKAILKAVLAGKSNALNKQPLEEIQLQILASIAPSITSVTIGEENNIIDIKYK